MTTLPSTSDLPESLVEHDQWVCWREQNRGDKPTKVPVNPHTGRYASSTDEETWGSFETACEYYVDGSAEGLGFVFCESDPFVGVDLDDARDPKEETPTDWAKTIIDELNSYTEISPSGTGYHVLIEGELPPRTESTRRRRTLRDRPVLHRDRRPRRNDPDRDYRAYNRSRRGVRRTRRRRK